jgi:hypothetical protein
LINGGAIAVILQEIASCRAGRLKRIGKATAVQDETNAGERVAPERLAGTP